MAGFRNVSVKCGESIANDQLKRIDIHHDITENKRHIIEEIVIAGADYFDDDQILDILKVGPGKPFYRTELDRGLIDLRGKYYDNGFSSHYIDLSVEFFEADGNHVNARVKIDILEGEQSYIDTILITGNRKTRLKTIQSRISKFEDKPYNTQNILKAQNAISETGLFSTVKTKSFPSDDDPSERVLLIDVTEQSSIFLEGGPGYNTDIGLNGYLSGYTNNLFGTNRYLGLSVFVSEETEKSQITYREPEFMGYPIQMELRLFRTITDEDGFDLFRYGGRVSWTYRFTEEFRSLLEYRLDSDKPINTDEDAVIPLDYRNSVKIASLAPGLIYDSRDDPRNPHDGRILSLRIEFARSVYSSEVDFTKATLDAVEFIPISETKTLGVSLRCGWGKDLPYQENFKLGGIKTIRGWDYEEIRGDLPEGIVLPGTDLKGSGGDFMLLGNIELRAAIFWGLQGVLFVDSGNVWEDMQSATFSDLKTSTGVGIRFLTPIGPVGVDYAYNVKRDDNDPRDRWSFVIGHTF